MAINRFGFGFACMVAVGIAAAACADDSDSTDAGNGAVDGGTGDGRSSAADGDANGGEDAGTDTGSTGDAAGDADAEVDAGPLPGVVTDLTAVAETHALVKLTWTAPPDQTGSGAVTHYDIRYATTPITTEAELLAATALETPPAPEAPGTSQTALLKLASETQYHVALRAQYDDESYGPLSNVVTVSTKPRATFLISEIAPANSAASGGDFIELVATKAGSAAELQVCAGSNFIFNPPCREIHELGRLDVSLGDRVVVHVRGLPGPTGFMQEDSTNSKTSSTEPFASASAFDVYANLSELDGLGAVAIRDGEVYQDAVAYSDRNPSHPEETVYHPVWGFMHFDELGAWSFSMADLDAWFVLINENDLCPFLLETVNASGDVPGECGGPAGTLTDGRSLQRSGVVDTNGPADFTVAPQTRGTAN